MYIQCKTKIKEIVLIYPHYIRINLKILRIMLLILICFIIIITINNFHFDLLCKIQRNK